MEEADEHFYELCDIADSDRMNEYVRRSPEAASDDLAVLVAWRRKHWHDTAPTLLEERDSLVAQVEALTSQLEAEREARGEYEGSPRYVPAQLYLAAEQHVQRLEGALRRIANDDLMAEHTRCHIARKALAQPPTTTQDSEEAQ